MATSLYRTTGYTRAYQTPGYSSARYMATGSGVSPNYSPSRGGSIFSNIGSRLGFGGRVMGSNPGTSRPGQYVPPTSQLNRVSPLAGSMSFDNNPTVIKNRANRLLNQQRAKDLTFSTPAWGANKVNINALRQRGMNILRGSISDADRQYGNIRKQFNQNQPMFSPAGGYGAPRMSGTAQQKIMVPADRQRQIIDRNRGWIKPLAQYAVKQFLGPAALPAMYFGSRSDEAERKRRQKREETLGFMDRQF